MQLFIRLFIKKHHFRAVDIFEKQVFRLGCIKTCYQGGTAALGLMGVTIVGPFPGGCTTCWALLAISQCQIACSGNYVYLGYTERISSNKS